MKTTRKSTINDESHADFVTLSDAYESEFMSIEKSHYDNLAAQKDYLSLIKLFMSMIQNFRKMNELKNQIKNSDQLKLKKIKTKTQLRISSTLQ